MFASRLQADGSWSEPVAIAPHLNQINGSLHPCLTDSGQTLVYGMFGGPSLHFDIFYAMRNDTGFGNAIRCDTTINTADCDSSPSAPVNGAYIIFDTRRNAQGGAPALLFQAQRVGTPVTPRPQYSPPETMNVMPTFGTNSTQFQIEVPASFAGSDLHIFNIAGQLIQRLTADRRDQLIYNWKGIGHETPHLSSGVYFVVAQNKQHTLASKLFLLH